MVIVSNRRQNRIEFIDRIEFIVPNQFNLITQCKFVLCFFFHKMIEVLFIFIRFKLYNLQVLAVFAKKGKKTL